MATENITEKVVEKVELAAEVGAKVANIVGNAFEKTIADSDPSPGAEEDTIWNYFMSFGIHILMVVIVLLLKWQYGRARKLPLARSTSIARFRPQSIPLSEGPT